MVQIILKLIITVFWLYLSFIVLKTVWLKQIDISFWDRWIKNEVETRIPTTTSGITVSPLQIALERNQWKGISSFNIHNPTKEIFYAIYLKLEIEGAGVSSQDIDVVPGNESDFIKGDMGAVSVNFDTVEVFGTDSNNKECIFLIIYSLAQGKNRSYRVHVKNTYTSGERARISIKLVKYSREPLQILEQGNNKVAFPFEFSENITVKGVRFLIKKK